MSDLSPVAVTLPQTPEPARGSLVRRGAPFTAAERRAYREELVTVQWTKLSRLLEYVYERSPFYRRRLDAAGAQPGKLKSLADYRRAVPLMRKEDVLADQEALPPLGERLSAALEQVVQINTTGGTSGAGQEVHGLTARDVAVLTTAFGEGLRLAGAGRGDRIALTYPTTMSGAPHWIYGACTRQHLTVLPLGSYNTVTKLRLMSTFEARFLIATPSYLQAMPAAAERELGWDVRRDLSVESLLTGGEAFSPERAAAIESAWGAKLFEWYGSTQRALAWTCEHGALHEDGMPGLLHHFPHVILLETLDPATGEPVDYGEYGEVVVTYMDAEASPLLRFAMGDRARLLPGDECRCHGLHDGYASGDITRYDDMMKVRGVNFWPSMTDDVFLSMPIVTNYVGRVFTAEDGSEQLSVDVEFAPDSTSEQRARALPELSSQLREAIGLRVDLREAEEALPSWDEPRAKARHWRDERAR